MVMVTMCRRVLSTRHDAVTELYNFRYLHDSLGVIAFIRKQYKEVEDMWYQPIRTPINRTVNKYFTDDDDVKNVYNITDPTDQL